MRSISVLVVTVMFLVGCGEEAPSEPEVVAEAPAAAPAPAPVAAPAPAPVAAPAPAAPAAAAPAAGEVVTVAALREGFASSQSDWVGREITLRGLFLGSTSVGGALNNVQLGVSTDENPMQTTTCGFGPGAPASVSFAEGDEITVTGAVRERFGRPALERCAIVE